MGFPGPIPTIEGPVAGAIRMLWNLVLSGCLGIGIGAFGTDIARQFIEAITGPLGPLTSTILSVVGWIAGCGSAFVLFMAYYLDDKEQ